jgi:hypothetical protein
VVERGGPLYFYIMVHKILSMSDDTIRLLTDRITHMNIKEDQGEDILKIVTIYRHTLKRLGNVKKVPHDMLTKLLEGLQTTSVDEFNATFHHIAISLKTDFNHQAHKLITIESCLDLAETLYVDHKEHGNWVGLPKGKIAAGLVAGTDVICWNCGKVGHLARDCVINPRLDAFLVLAEGVVGLVVGEGDLAQLIQYPQLPENHKSKPLTTIYANTPHLTEEHVVGAGRAQNASQSPQTSPAPQAQVMVNVVSLPPPPEPVGAAPGRTAPPLDPVVVDLMTDESQRAERVNWYASVLHRAPAQH